VSSGKADAFASIREMLMQCSAKLPGSRVLGDSYQTNLAGIAVAKERSGRLAYLTEFLDDMKRSGELKKILDGADLRGVEIVMPKASN
jgi:polar amino acid transport system substrate-binding protein